MNDIPNNANEVESNELQAFVASTLTAIMKGVSDAQPAARASSAHGTGEFAFNPPDAVDFSIGANVGGDSSSEAATVSRIQFKIPTRFRSDRSRGER